MQLYSRIIGSGPPILVLHGVFGMSDNWVTIGSALAEHGFTVHLLDLRNHGRSPHAETHRYPDMCDDLNHYLEQNKLAIVDIIGHSMGGKLAMMYGLLDPEKLRKLVIVDIAPSDYRNLDNSFHADIITTLLQIEFLSHFRQTISRRRLETNEHTAATRLCCQLEQFLIVSHINGDLPNPFFAEIGFNHPTE